MRAVQLQHLPKTFLPGVYSAESARVFRFQSARFCLSQNQVNDFLTYRALSAEYTLYPLNNPYPLDFLDAHFDSGLSHQSLLSEERETLALGHF